MLNALIVTRRELVAYFASPLAYVFIVIFLALSGALTFYVGGFFERGQADLEAFFLFHPWLYLFLVPALAMRLWAEERKSGTMEFLMTLPLTAGQAVIGKFLAAWIFAGIALALTFPVWITVGWLGEPDHGVIGAAYLGSWLMAGGYLAVGSALSALTRNQVIAFVLAASVSFLLLMAGVEVVQRFLSSFLPLELASAVAGLSFQTHFQSLSQGVIEVKDVAFFLSLIVAALIANTLIVELKKAS
ncbi:MAG TPA: ABC transporter permease [Kiloniellales bacterium]|nr:ABC transporter permease [Kiloniellales bacterium]